MAANSTRKYAEGNNKPHSDSHTHTTLIAAASAAATAGTAAAATAAAAAAAATNPRYEFRPRIQIVGPSHCCSLHDTTKTPRRHPAALFTNPKP